MLHLLISGKISDFNPPPENAQRGDFAWIKLDARRYMDGAVYVQIWNIRLTPYAFKRHERLLEKGKFIGFRCDNVWVHLADGPDGQFQMLCAASDEAFIL